MRKREHWRALALGIRVERVRLDVGLVFKKPIENINGLPDTTRNEVREERDVGVRHVVIANAAVPSVADVIFRKQVLLVQIPAGSVSGGGLSRAPVLWERKKVIGIYDRCNGLFEFRFRDVPLIDPGILPAVDISY